jgi:hypothetical protein
VIFLGLAGLFQITFVPGFLLLRLARHQGSLLQRAAYSFGTSLLVNYLLVYWLVSAGLYSRTIVGALITVEWAALAGVLAKNGFRWRWQSGRSALLSAYNRVCGTHPLAAAALGVAALATIIVFVGVFIGNIGSVFVLGDDVVSWDRWAMGWAAGQVPGSGGYPQVLPANWSITYLLLGTTDVKMFAKAIMPLFPLGTLLLFAALFERTSQLTWLAALNIYALVLIYVLDTRFWRSGYADIPSSFFAFLTLYAFLELVSAEGPQSRFRLVAPILFGAAAMQTKQSGIFIFCVAVVACAVWLFKRRAQFPRPMLLWTCASWFATAVIVNWWQVALEWSILRSPTATQLVTIDRVIPNTGGYAERWAAAFNMLRSLHGPSAAWFIPALFSLMLIGTPRRDCRLVFFAVAAPFYAIWALFFSYERRTLALFIPFAAFCAAGGLQVLAGMISKAVLRVSLLAGGSARSRVSLGVCLLAGASMLVYLILHDRSGWWVAFKNTTWVIAIGQMWPWAILVGALLVWIVGPVVRRPDFAVSLNAIAILVPVVLVLAILNVSVLSRENLTAAQLEAQKSVGVAELNWALYQYHQRPHFAGLIATDYWCLGSLPGLRSYYRPTHFPDRIDIGVIRSVAAEPAIEYVLVSEAKLPDATLRWMESQHFTTEIRKAGYRMVRVPADFRPTGELSATPNPIRVCDGSGLGITTISWKSTGTTTVSVRLNTRDEQGFPAEAPSAGQVTTGKWVPDGTQVFLQDVSRGRPLTASNTLATLTIHTTTENCRTNASR